MEKVEFSNSGKSKVFDLPEYASAGESWPCACKCYCTGGSCYCGCTCWKH